MKIAKVKLNFKGLNLGELGLKDLNFKNDLLREPAAGVLKFLKGAEGHYAIRRPFLDGTYALNIFSSCRSGNRLSKISPFSFEKGENVRFHYHWISDFNIEADSKA